MDVLGVREEAVEGHVDEAKLFGIKVRMTTRITTVPGSNRLVVRGNSYTAQYRPGRRGEWQTAAKDRFPRGGRGKDQISLQCYDGPPDAEMIPVRRIDQRLVGIFLAMQ